MGTVRDTRLDYTSLGRSRDLTVTWIKQQHISASHQNSKPPSGETRFRLFHILSCFTTDWCLTFIWAAAHSESTCVRMHLSARSHHIYIHIYTSFFLTMVLTHRTCELMHHSMGWYLRGDPVWLTLQCACGECDSFFDRTDVETNDRRVTLCTRPRGCIHLRVCRRDPNRNGLFANATSSSTSNKYTMAAFFRFFWYIQENS